MNHKLSSNIFIILRGPSAAGKTTVAKKLFKKAKGKTALIQQDYYRFIFKPAGGGSTSNAHVIHQMIEHNTAIALQSGYNVILEGILSVKSYQSMIERLITVHSGKSYIFYFDVSFEETVKRHQTKEANFEYGQDEMREWFPAAHTSGHELETILPESYSENQIVEKIINVTKFEVE